MLKHTGIRNVTTYIYLQTEKDFLLTTPLERVIERVRERIKQISCVFVESVGKRLKRRRVVAEEEDEQKMNESREELRFIVRFNSTH